MFVFVVLVVMQCDTPILETFLGEKRVSSLTQRSPERDIDDAEANERRFLRRGCGTRERQLEQQQKRERRQNAYHMLWMMMTTIMRFTLMMVKNKIDIVVQK
jgi:hypothetical protein